MLQSLAVAAVAACCSPPQPLTQAIPAPAVILLPAASDVDPRDIAALQHLLAQLAAAKQQSWSQRRQAAVRHRSQRIIRLQQERLSHVLIESVELPQSLRDSATLLCKEVIALRIQLEEAEAEETEGQPAADTADREERIAQLMSRLEAAETKHRSAVAIIAATEADQRKVWLASGDEAALSRYNRTQHWSYLRRAMSTDPTLAAQLAEVESSVSLLSSSFASALSPASPSAAVDLAGILSSTEALLAEYGARSREAAALSWERDALWARLQEERVRFEVDREREREEWKQAVTGWRQAVEDDKRRMEERWQTMLAEAVKDAVSCSEEAARLRQAMELRDRRL